MKVPVWAQWASIPALTVLLPALLRLAPEILPVLILIIPIAWLIGQDDPLWRKDRA